MTTASGYPEAKAARGAMLLLSLLGLFLAMDITLTTLLIEPMKRDLGLTDIEIGLIQGTAFGLAFGLSSIPLGRVIDRSNRARLLLIGLLIGMAAMLGSAFAGGFATLVMCRVALGIVAALIIPAALSIIADLFPPQKRSVATSLFAVGQGVGQAFGILGGGLAFDALTRFLAGNADALLGLSAWRTLYVAAATLGLPLLFGLLLLREPARQERQAEARQALAAVREVWAYRGFILPLLAAMLFSQILVHAVAVWSTPILIRDYGLTPGGFAGWLSAVTLLGSIAGALVGGQLGELGRRRGGRAGVLLPALVAALVVGPLSFFAMAPSIPLFAGLLLLHLMAGAVIATLGVVAITLIIPNEIRGTAMGVNVFVTAVFGAATAPALIAFVSKAMGGETMLAEALAAVSVPSAIGAALCFALAMRGAARLAPSA